MGVLGFRKKKGISGRGGEVEKYMENIVIGIGGYEEMIREGWDMGEERCGWEGLV